MFSKDQFSKDKGEEKKKTLSCYTIKLSDKEMKALEKWCDRHLMNFYEVPYAHFGFKGDDLNIVGYKSGKLVIQGKKTESFVTYVLEGEITKTPLLGYDKVLHPEWFEPHAGLDESGKGDFFGPLVSACVIANEQIVDEWMDKDLKESKNVSSDLVVLRMDKMIRQTKGVVVHTTFAKMPKYNELYRRFGNLNELLAWMHAKSLEGALQKKRVPWGMLDQFSKKKLVQKYFTDVAKDFDLRMRTKAESDPIVAAASIVARAEFIRQLRKLGKEFGSTLQKGASAKVKEQGVEIIKKFGPESLGDFAKLHFKTAREALYQAK